MIKSKCSIFDDDAKNVVDCEVFVVAPQVYGALKSVKKDKFLMKEVFGYVSTKREDHKNNTKSTFSDAFAESENTTKLLHF
tara:strand:- start:879 stop:1121 length:243 start_codon:yes stop_codon:yes gene_type:complete